MKLKKLKAELIGFNAKGDSEKQEITLALIEEQKTIPIGTEVEVKILNVHKDKNTNTQLMQN